MYLWPVAASCRTLVGEAGVDSSEMTFDEPNALRWESVIRESEKQESLNILTPVLLSKYPKNRRLQEAVEPWIHGNPPAVNGATIAKGVDMAAPAVQAETEPVIVTTETPTTITTTIQKKKVPGTNVEVELTPVLVPKDQADAASTALLATISSLRLTVAQHERDLEELIKWRQAISTLSRAEVAERTGGNEPGDSIEDPVVTLAKGSPE